MLGDQYDSGSTLQTVEDSESWGVGESGWKVVHFGSAALVGEEARGETVLVGIAISAIMGPCFVFLVVSSLRLLVFGEGRTSEE